MESDNKQKNISIDWRNIVFDKIFLAKLDKLCQRRFQQTTTAEECSSYVLDQLTRENFKKFQSYQGLSKPTTFLHTLSINLIEEFSRKHFGRPRPPVWVEKQGELWVRIWRSLSIERQVSLAVIDRFSNLGFDKEKVKHAIKVIKCRIPDCGKEAVRTVSPECLADAESFYGEDFRTQQQESLLLERHAGVVLHSILNSILADEVDIRPVQQSAVKQYGLSDQQQNTLIKLKNALSLSDQEKILIRMVYVDGFSKTTAARALNLANHKGGKIINSALNRIRTAFENNGFDINAFYRELN